MDEEEIEGLPLDTDLDALPSDEEVAPAPAPKAPPVAFADMPPEAQARARQAEEFNARRGRAREMRTIAEHTGTPLTQAILPHLVDAALEVQETPESLLGAVQGATGGWGDEMYGRVRATYDDQSSERRRGMGAGMARHGLPGVAMTVLADYLADPETQDEQAAEYEEPYDAALQRAEERAPTAYGASYALGALGAGMAVPMPTSAAGTVPWWMRAGQFAGWGGLQGAATGAGEAQPGQRMEGAAMGAPIGALGGLVGFGVDQGADYVLRSPGAFRGLAEWLGPRADEARLSATGIRGPAALQAADRDFGGTMVGRRELADQLREAHVGERAGIPMPGPALDDAFRIRGEVGQQIGNPLRGGPDSAGTLERQIDEAGGFVDMNAFADDMLNATSHEEGLIGGVQGDVARSIIIPARQAAEEGPISFTRGHMQRQAFQQRDFGVPDEYTRRAAEIMDRHLLRAAETADQSRMAQAGEMVDFRALGDRVEQQLIAEGGDPAIARQIGDDLRGAGTVDFRRAARVREQLPLQEQVRAQGARLRDRPPPRPRTGPMAQAQLPAAPEPSGTRRLGRGAHAPAPEAPPPAPEAGGTRPGRRRPAPAPEAPPPAPAPAEVAPPAGGTRPGRRRGAPPPAPAPLFAGPPGTSPFSAGPAPVNPLGATRQVPGIAEVPQAPPSLFPDVPVRQEAPFPVVRPRRPPTSFEPSAAPAPAPQAPPPGPPPGFSGPPARRPGRAAPPPAVEPPLYPETRVPLPEEVITRGQEAIDQELADIARRHGPTLADQWEDANRQYAMTSHVLDHSRPAPGLPMDLGAAAATREALAGNPMALARLHGTRAAGGMMQDVGRGVWARGLEGATAGADAVSSRLTRILGTNPERLGPYAQGIAQAAARGSAALAAHHYQQSQRDAAYRAWMERLAEEEETGTDPAVYDMLTHGLTTEDL